MRFEFFCELTLYFVMFNLSYLIACSLIFYMDSNREDIISFVLSGLLLVNSLITIIIYIKHNNYFQRFRYTFRPTSLTFHHYVLHILCIVLSIVMMIIYQNILGFPLYLNFYCSSTQ